MNKNTWIFRQLQLLSDADATELLLWTLSNARFIGVGPTAVPVDQPMNPCFNRSDYNINVLEAERYFCISVNADGVKCRTQRAGFLYIDTDMLVRRLKINTIL